MGTVIILRLEYDCLFLNYIVSGNSEIMTLAATPPPADTRQFPMQAISMLKLINISKLPKKHAQHMIIKVYFLPQLSTIGPETKLPTKTEPKLKDFMTPRMMF